MAIAVGARFDHFEVIAPLGAGGMGEVYLARDTRLDRRVALKLLPAEFTTNRDRVRRFEQEAKAASSLNHPNIITVYEIGESDGAHFIAAEYVDGQTLRQRMQGEHLKLPARSMSRFKLARPFPPRTKPASRTATSNPKT